MFKRSKKFLAWSFAAIMFANTIFGNEWSYMGSTVFAKQRVEESVSGNQQIEGSVSGNQRSESSQSNADVYTLTISGNEVFEGIEEVYFKDKSNTENYLKEIQVHSGETVELVVENKQFYGLKKLKVANREIVFDDEREEEEKRYVSQPGGKYVLLIDEITQSGYVEIESQKYEVFINKTKNGSLTVNSNNCKYENMISVDNDKFIINNTRQNSQDIPQYPGIYGKVNLEEVNNSDGTYS